LFNRYPSNHLLDLDRAKSVFSLFFLFAIDPSIKKDEQISLNELLGEIFLGFSMPKESRKRLASLYEEVLISPPNLFESINLLLSYFSSDRISIISFVKILIRIISDDGLISNRHARDLYELLTRANFSLIELESFTDEEQAIMSFAYPNQESTNKENLLPYFMKLGCNPDASIDEVKKNYRILALKYHPDMKSSEKNISTKNIDSDESFNDIHLAYSILIKSYQK
jgi:DnaJ like chaperone protein